MVARCTLRQTDTSFGSSRVTRVLEQPNCAEHGHHKAVRSDNCP